MHCKKNQPCGHFVQFLSDLLAQARGLDADKRPCFKPKRGVRPLCGYFLYVGIKNGRNVN